MAIMVTREPHCFQTILGALKSGALAKAEPAVVLSNRRDLEPLARKHRLPFVQIPWEDRLKAEQHALRLLDEHEVDFIVLARFMKILSPNFVWRFKNKIINIHPSLLPSFPGPQAYRQAYEQGVKIIGVSSHFVTMNLDEGPIIAQDCFAVQPRMTLKQIVTAGTMAPPSKTTNETVEEPSNKSAPAPQASEEVIPKTGVEVMPPEDRQGGRYYTMRDLRNGNVVKNVTRASARRLWHYAITQFNEIANKIDQVETGRGDRPKEDVVINSISIDWMRNSAERQSESLAGC